MAELKHVGRNIANKRKCIVAYRVVPNAPEYCLVVHTESLDAEQHDSLIKLVESNAGQTAYELAEAMGRTRLPDGRNMLQAFHIQGKLTKTLSKDIEMVPNSQTSINLAELNQMIAEARGVTVADLALGITSKEQKEAQSEEQVDPVQAYTNQPTANETSVDEPLSDEKLAAQYRAQADSLAKEVEQLRKQADELDPPQAPAKKAAPKTSRTTKSTTAKPAAKTTKATKKETSG